MQGYVYLSHFCVIVLGVDRFPLSNRVPENDPDSKREYKLPEILFVEIEN